MTDDITLAFVGDISFGDFLFCQGYGVRSHLQKATHNLLFDNVVTFFQGKDIVFGNLETVLSHYGAKENCLHSMDMRGDPASIAEINHAGFNVLNVANNHIMQHGGKAFQETVSLLDSNGVHVLGLTDQKLSSRPVILNIGGQQVGILGYAFEVDRYFQGPLPYAFGAEEAIEEDIGLLRPKVDLLIVSCHWGLEFMDRPSVAMIRSARRMVDLGVDIVVGHHPHVLQGIEEYHGSIIAYSLGNFIFDMMWNLRLRESVMLEINVTREGEISYKYEPVVINKFYQPTPLTEINEREKFVEYFERLSGKINIELTGDIEKNCLKYYLEFIQKNRKDRLAAYKFFFKNLYHYNLTYFPQQIGATIKSKIEDLVSF